MPLENPNFISDFDQAAPHYQDQRSEGDDHIRNVKKAILATFPGFAGRVFRKRTVSASGAANLTDNGALLNVTTTAVITPAAAASLGNGWACFVRAGNGNVTIDPTSSEKVNGNLDLIIPTGYTGLLFCDGTEFYAMLMYKDVPTETPSFPTGTRAVFQQTSAPSGWTKVTNVQYNDAVPRFTTGTVGTGGAVAFTTNFGVGKTTGERVLTLTQIPPHGHSYTASDYSAVYNLSGPGGWSVGPVGATTGSAGGGAGHDHPLNNNDVKYVDLIVATKD